MKRKKEDRLLPEAHPVLYATRRFSLQEKDFELPGQRKKHSFRKGMERLADAFYAAISRLSQFFHGNAKKQSAGKRMPATSPRVAPQKGFLKESKWFYMAVSFGVVFLIGGAVAVAASLSDALYATVTVNDEGCVFAAKTEEKTVEDFFRKNDIALDDSDVVDVSLSAPIEDGMEISIHRAMPVTILHGKQEKTIKMLAGTVSEALERADIDVAPEDEVYPAADSYVVSDLTINIIDVETKTIKETEPIYYKEITKNDASLAKGKTKVVQKGQNGVQENTIEVVYKNGVEVSRKTVDQKVTKQAINEITSIGTYVAPTPAPTKKPSSGTRKPQATKKPSQGGGSSSSGKYTTNSEGKVTKTPSISLIHSGSLYEHKNAPKPDDSIVAKAVVINHVTAYCIKGNRTATGTWPKIGTIAADPKRFPYGTKVYVPGYGYAVVEDTGGFRNESRTVFDLWMPNRSDALKWGRKYDLKVYILK